MKRMTTLALASVLALILGLGSSVVMAADQKAAEAAIAAAEKSRKNAASVAGEWRDTGGIIKKAQAAMKEGKHDKAIKLANFAERQGKYGYEQAVSQKDFKVPSYLKY